MKMNFIIQFSEDSNFNELSKDGSYFFRINLYILMYLI